MASLKKDETISNMQKLLLVFALMATVAIHAQQPGLAPVLSGYYGVRDALVRDDAKTAAAAAGELLKAVNGVNMSSLPEKDHKTFMALQNKLAFDARHISESSDIGHQREHFANLSANMVLLAKQAQLSQQPIYEQYCPMKKAYWLSSETVIRNPYFGSSMISCGKVTNTLKP
jgi:hypothetical protein